MNVLFSVSDYLAQCLVYDEPMEEDLVSSMHHAALPVQG
jgi:hypothetical protein